MWLIRHLKSSPVWVEMCCEFKTANYHLLCLTLDLKKKRCLAGFWRLCIQKMTQSISLMCFLCWLHIEMIILGIYWVKYVFILISLILTLLHLFWMQLLYNVKWYLCPRWSGSPSPEWQTSNHQAWSAVGSGLGEVCEAGPILGSSTWLYNLTYSHITFTTSNKQNRMLLSCSLAGMLSTSPCLMNLPALMPCLHGGHGPWREAIR